MLPSSSLICRKYICSSTIRLPPRCRHRPILLPRRLPQPRPDLYIEFHASMERNIPAQRNSKPHNSPINFSTLTIEQHWARPIIHTLPSTGRQILFTASNQNRIRTFDAATGELLNERQILVPWPMDQANCSELGKTMGIMGTPVVYTDYEDGIAFFYVKSYIE
jgi:hypothetical protein